MNFSLDIIYNWVIDNKEWLFSGVALPPLFFIAKAGSGIFRTERGFSGYWNILVGEEVYGEMKIRTFGPILLGSAKTAVKQADEGIRRHIYKYVGRITRDQAVLIFKEVDQANRIVGATVLRMMRDKNKISGRNIYWHHDKGEICDTKFVMRRQFD
ncbi:hypothetical protein [Rhodobacter sp. TJ_12]|uniref:hypothetical protein n=1 Tax=Rhodobacter sp. TJ_12 TaxID=2029399 RepID=UPI001CBD3638|nr:hypothetical protein [Rhodobacter sp. TJ_12]